MIYAYIDPAYMEYMECLGYGGLLKRLFKDPEILSTFLTELQGGGRETCASSIGKESMSLKGKPGFLIVRDSAAEMHVLGLPRTAHLSAASFQAFLPTNEPN